MSRQVEKSFTIRVGGRDIQIPDVSGSLHEFDTPAMEAHRGLLNRVAYLERENARAIRLAEAAREEVSELEMRVEMALEPALEHASDMRRMLTLLEDAHRERREAVSDTEGSSKACPVHYGGTSSGVSAGE